MSSAEARLHEIWATPSTLWGWLTTVDHKELGRRYIWTAFAFLVVGGIEALAIRLQLARADQRIIAPEAYDQLFTMHGVTMIFWYASPILSGFGNYLIPLMLGARDMAFPRLNAFTYWSFLLSGVFLYTSLVFGEAPHAGWFAYVPYSNEHFSPGLGMDFYALSLLFLTASTTGGAINFIVTIFRHRAEGMTVSRMPLFMYSTLTTSFTIVFSLPALTAALVFLELDRKWGFHFYDVSHGGSPVLWQQLFWFFGHPWVYIVFLPATGMISMILPVFSRRPIVGYPYVATATVMTGVVGFGVWVHHMFAIGMSWTSMSFFSAASMTISIFSAVQVFAWVATMWRGRPVMKTPMLFAVGFLIALVIGGLSGVVTAVVPFDWQVHDTYFVVAHLHYVLVGANVLPVFAAIYYWYPKMTGRMPDEKLGKWSFWLVFLGFNATFFPMHAAGLLAMKRRIYTYGFDTNIERLNMLASIGALILATGVAVAIWNFITSYRRGAVAGKNPWHADTLEWSTESPPAVYGSVHLPTVRSRHPLWDDHDEEHDPGDARVFDDKRVTLSTSWLHAHPEALAKMPEDTAMPLLAALTMLAICFAILAKALAFAVVAGLATAVVAAAWLMPREEKTPTTPVTEERAAPLVTAIDDRRGVAGMWLFIGTEAMLFVLLFFTYFYLGPYPSEPPPKLKFALPMLAILLASSAVLHWGEGHVKKGHAKQARAGLVGTLVLGVAFVVLQVLEYREHLQTLVPQASSYASIFYTLTSVHAFHLLLGLGMLTYVLFLPRVTTGFKPPHRPYQAASHYWHFVDLVWVFIVALVYVLPNLKK